MDDRAEQAAEAAAVLVGAGLRAFELAWWAAGPLRTASLGLLRRGIATTSRIAPTRVAALAARGRSGLVGLNALVDVVLRFAIARVVDAFLAEVDVTALVREHVDLDVVASGIDVDKIVSRVDMDAIVRRIDLDAIAVGLDVDAVVARVDLDAIVRRIDLDAIARGLDLDAVVARVDLEAVVRRIDLDAIAGELDVDAVVARVDLDAIVHRMDLIGIASEVVDGIDLAGIIRQSSGALASDSVRTIRTEAMHADDVLSGVVDRVLGRRRPRPDVGTVG